MTEEIINHDFDPPGPSRMQYLDNHYRRLSAKLMGLKWDDTNYRRDDDHDTLTLGKLPHPLELRLVDTVMEYIPLALANFETWQRMKPEKKFRLLKRALKVQAKSSGQAGKIGMRRRGRKPLSIEKMKATQQKFQDGLGTRWKNERQFSLYEDKDASWYGKIKSKLERLEGKKVLK